MACTNAAKRTGSGKCKSPSHLQGPKGYPGMCRTIQEAHKYLVFLLDNRAPMAWWSCADVVLEGDGQVSSGQFRVPRC